MTQVVLKNGDSLEVLKTIQDSVVGVVICDPPYNIGYAGHSWDKKAPLTQIWNECFRVLKPGGYLVAFGDHRLFHKTITELEGIGFELISGMAWMYPNGTPACQRIDDEHHCRVKPSHEPLGIFIKPILEKTYKLQRARHGNSGLRVQNTIEGIKMTTTILEYNKPTPSERDLGVEHLPLKRVNPRNESKRSLNKTAMRRNHGPCVKSIALMYHLCRLVAGPNDIILDPFMGTGATGMAAVWNNQKFIGIERDKGYFEVAKFRTEYALNNLMPKFPLRAPQRRKLSKSEWHISKQTLLNSPWLKTSNDLSELLPLRRSIKVRTAIKHLLASVSEFCAQIKRLANRAINQTKVAVCGHTEEALPTAGVSPNITYMPLVSFPLVEVPALVFHDEDTAIIKHRNEVRIKFGVGKLEPKGRLFAFDISNPIANPRMTVQVDRTVELFARCGKVSHQTGVVLVELGCPTVRLIRGVGLLVKNYRQVGASREVLRIGSKKSAILAGLALATQMLDQLGHRLSKVILVAGQHIQFKARSHQGLYGLGYEHYRTWLGDVWVNDARV